MAATVAAHIPRQPSSGCACSSDRELESPLSGVPIHFEIGDELRTVVAVRLFATVHRHVPAELIDRLLADPDRLAIAGRADHAGARQRLNDRVQGTVHRAVIYD